MTPSEDEVKSTGNKKILFTGTVKEVEGEDDPAMQEPGFEVNTSCKYARDRNGMDSKRG